MLLFSLYDHDVITFNDFGGEAILNLRDVPGISGGKTSASNFHGLKQVDLPLMFQANPGNKVICSFIYDGFILILVSDDPILTVLSERPGDKPAQDFVKKQKERFKIPD